LATASSGRIVTVHRTAGTGGLRDFPGSPCRPVVRAGLDGVHRATAIPDASSVSGRYEPPIRLRQSPIPAILAGVEGGIRAKSGDHDPERPGIKRRASEFHHAVCARTPESKRTLTGTIEGRMGTKSYSIAHLLNEIRDEDIVLPDLQREFVWQRDQIRLLFDSIMQGYPFGSLLPWETRFLDVYYRDFVRDARDGITFFPKMKAAGKPKRMVLDGQQRLQSLYLGLYGSHNGSRLYFDVTSGPESQVRADEDEDQALGKYRFAFWRDEDTNRPNRFVRASEIFDWSPKLEDDEIRRVIQRIPLGSGTADQAARNMRFAPIWSRSRQSTRR
jgi:Protein of unknown function DUF262